MNMPTFSAEKSLYTSGSYRTGTSGILSAIPSSVRPQALRGGFGGFGHPAMIHWDCNRFGDCCTKIGSTTAAVLGLPIMSASAFERSRKAAVAPRSVWPSSRGILASVTRLWRGV